MRSSVPLGRRSATWHRCRRAQPASIAGTPAPGAEEPLGSLQQAAGNVCEYDSILLHYMYQYRCIMFAKNTLRKSPIIGSRLTVKFLAIAHPSHHDTMGQRCKGRAGRSDGCAWTARLKEGAHARS
jgi:hypothetical protein